MQGAEEGDSEREEEPEFDKMAEVRDAEGGRQRAQHYKPEIRMLPESDMLQEQHHHTHTRVITQSSSDVDRNS